LVKELTIDGNFKFSLCAPATDQLAQWLIKFASTSIDSASNYIATGNQGDIIRGLKIYCDLTTETFLHQPKLEEPSGLSPDHLLRAYIYYNPLISLTERQSFFINLNKIRDLKQKDQLNLVRFTEYDRFLLFAADGSIEINELEVDKYLAKEGYFVILSNIDQTPQEFYDIFQIKRNILDINNSFIKHINFYRFNYLAKSNYDNTSFMIFLSNIIFSYIYNIYSKSDIVKKFTLSNILSELNSLKSFKYKNNEYINQINTMQKDIFDAFSISHPSTL
jgi:hypothetical protein